MKHREGAIHLPKASPRPTSKPLKTIAENHFTSRHPSPLEGYETDCSLTPKHGNESALRHLRQEFGWWMPWLLPGHKAGKSEVVQCSVLSAIFRKFITLSLYLSIG
jgi:hypothetical protein